jgi:phage tail-like protein
MALVNPVPVFDFTVFFMNAPPPPGSSSTSGLGAAVGTIVAAGVAAATLALTGTFSEVNGLNAEIETEEYREGGRNVAAHKFVKWGKYPNLVFKRGVTPNTDLWDWYYQVLYGTGTVVRRNGFIVLTDRTASVAGLPGLPSIPGLGGINRFPIAFWSFNNGLPEKLQGPGLNAKTNEIAIETLEIAHEGLIRVGAAMTPGVGNVLAAVGL